MAKDKFETFKASDVQKKQPRPKARAGAAKDSKKEAVSAGFPSIEGLLDKETLDLQGLEQRMAELNSLAEGGSAQQKGAARKALIAYEKTQDLLEYLWETKTALSEPEA